MHLFHGNRISSLRFETFLLQVMRKLYRGSRQETFLEISQNSQENTCAREPATLLKKSLWHRCFPVNFTKFLRTFFYRTSPVAASELYRGLWTVLWTMLTMLTILWTMLKSATFLKKRFWHRCFPVSFAKFLRTPFLQNTSGWLLLQMFINIWK